MEHTAQVHGHEDLHPIARLLAGHPWVSAARAVVRPGTSGLLIVPADAGLQAYRCLGRAGIAGVWASHLGTPLPGLWRLVDALPTVFDGPIDSIAATMLVEPLPNLPAEQASSNDPGGVVQYALRVPLELGIFRSHFPVAPIVPGVEQVRWVIDFGRRHFALPARFAGLDMLRFRQVMQPGSALHLTLRFVASSGTLHFDFRSADRPEKSRISDGRVLFCDANTSLRKFP